MRKLVEDDRDEKEDRGDGRRKATAAPARSMQSWKREQPRNGQIRSGSPTSVPITGA
jgi:hypothetical protein